MTTLTEVVDLLGRLTTGGMRDRVAAVGHARALIGRLTAEEKRELAIRVAERVAPQLVPQIRAGAGEDLSPEQVATVLELFRRLDAGQVAELRRVLSDPAERTDLLTGVVDELAAEVGSVPPPAPAEDPASPDPAPRAQASPAHTAPVEAAVDAPAEAGGQTGGQVDEPVPAPAATEPPVAAATPDTLAAIRAAPTAAARLRAVTDADPVVLWRAGPEYRRQLLEALPDGWQRRRALHRLLDLDVISADEAVALVGLFARRGDRVWVAARLVEVDLFDGDDLAQVLDARAATRLAARTS